MELAKAYWGLKKSSVSYAIANRELEHISMELQIAETEHRTHRVSDLNYETTRIESLERESDLRIRGRDYIRAFKHYLHVLGFGDSDRISSPAMIPELTDSPNDEGLKSVQSVGNHPEIRRLAAELDAASAREKTAKAEHMPKIDLFAKHSLIGRDSSSWSEAFGDTQSEYSIIGLKLSMNIFNGFRTEEKIDQAEADVKIKQLQLEQKKKDLAEEEDARKTALMMENEELSLALEKKKFEEMKEKIAKTELKAGRISRFTYQQTVINVENAIDQILLARIDEVLARNALDLLLAE